MKYLLIAAAIGLTFVIIAEMQKRTLIALVKTPGEGGTIQMTYPTLADCEVAGFNLRKSFETDSRVTVIWRCVK